MHSEQTCNDLFFCIARGGELGQRETGSLMAEKRSHTQVSVGAGLILAWINNPKTARLSIGQIIVLWSRENQMPSHLLVEFFA